MVFSGIVAMWLPFSSTAELCVSNFIQIHLAPIEDKAVLTNSLTCSLYGIGGALLFSGYIGKRIDTWIQLVKCSLSDVCENVSI
jgi:hypothetical protein